MATLGTTEKSGRVSDPTLDPLRVAKALFEKAVSNGEQIGAIKGMPFNVREVERVRSLYKECDRFFDDIVTSIKNHLANK